VKDPVSLLVALGGSLPGVAFAAAGLSAVRGIADLVDLPPLGALPAPPPRALTVVVAARDEAASLEAAVGSLLRVDYPDLEVVAVNDRSADETGAILDRMAARDPRLQVVHLTDLPPGWLGKVHALSKAVAVARGDWVLFTDADVHFGPDTLLRAVAYAEAHGLDHLTGLPDIRGRGLLLDVLITTFGQLLFGKVRAATLNNPTAPEALGIGAFNLARRSRVADPAIWEWLRMEVADDMGLALAIKRRGGRGGVVGLVREVRVDWYTSLGAMFRGLEKNLYGAVGGYSPLRAFGGVALGLILYGGMAVWAIGGQPWLPGLALAVGLACFVVGDAWVRWRIGRPMGRAILAPLGLLMVVAAMAWSAGCCLRRGGVVWRGTFYPVSALRAGRRVAM